jgi:hypothetical protein
MPDLKTQAPALLDEVRATGIPFHGNEYKALKVFMGTYGRVFFNFVFNLI